MEFEDSKNFKDFISNCLIVYMFLNLLRFTTPNSFPKFGKLNIEHVQPNFLLQESATFGPAKKCLDPPTASCAFEVS